MVQRKAFSKSKLIFWVCPRGSPEYKPHPVSGSLGVGPSALADSQAISGANPGNCRMPRAGSAGKPRSLRHVAPLMPCFGGLPLRSLTLAVGNNTNSVQIGPGKFSLRFGNARRKKLTALKEMRFCITIRFVYFVYFYPPCNTVFAC